MADARSPWQSKRRGWDALAAKEMINIDLIHPQTVKWDINKDEKLATVKLRRDAG